MCPECKGTGKITLFTSTVDCKTCQGWVVPEKKPFPPMGNISVPWKDILPPTFPLRVEGIGDLGDLLSRALSAHYQKHHTESGTYPVEIVLPLTRKELKILWAARTKGLQCVPYYEGIPSTGIRIVASGRSWEVYLTSVSCGYCHFVRSDHVEQLILERDKEGKS